MSWSSRGSTTRSTALAAQRVSREIATFLEALGIRRPQAAPDARQALNAHLRMRASSACPSASRTARARRGRAVLEEAAHDQPLGPRSATGHGPSGKSCSRSTWPSVAPWVQQPSLARISSPGWSWRGLLEAAVAVLLVGIVFCASCSTRIPRAHRRRRVAQCSLEGEVRGRVGRHVTLVRVVVEVLRHRRRSTPR